MPAPVIYDNSGSGHNLSLGAFDSTSITKPGQASVLLAEQIGKPFDSSFEELLKDYHYDVEKAEPGMMEKLWATYMKPGLKNAGAALWTLGAQYGKEAVAALAGVNPTTAAAVAAGEAILTSVLGGFFTGEVKPKSIKLKRGQWVFIEHETSLKRRRLGQKMRMPVMSDPKVRVLGGKPESLYLKPGQTYDPSGKQQAEPGKLPSVVSLGFFVDAGEVSVFNMDTGRVMDAQITQVYDVGTEIAERCDNDPVLSVVRELFFYKLYGDEWEIKHPKELRAGTQVLYKGFPYTLIQTDSGTSKAMIEDNAGNIQVVPHGDVTRGMGKTTQGKKDSLFETQGANIHTGQWVWVCSDGNRRQVPHHDRDRSRGQPIAEGAGRGVLGDGWSDGCVSRGRPLNSRQGNAEHF